MPGIRVVWYRESGNVPLRRWLDSLAPRARFKCTARMGLLETFGHGLRPPLAEHLGDGIYELRVRDGRLRLRLLYFFQGIGLAVVSNGFIKKTAAVPEPELLLARRRRQLCGADPAAHIFDPEG